MRTVTEVNSGLWKLKLLVAYLHNILQVLWLTSKATMVFY